MKQYTLTISDIRKETSDTTTLCFKQPGLRKIKYKAGQYITLIVRINGRKYARPYSFSSAPSVDATLEVTVKRVFDGIVSNYINNELKVGDVLQVLEPMGNFTFDIVSSIQNIFLWGVGSGITPLFSILKELLHKHPDTSIHLIYGNKSIESTIFKKQLDLLIQDNPAVFSMTNFYSQEDIVEESDAIQKGRINTDFVTRLLSQNNNVKKSLHYICGPNNLKNTITSTLVEVGLSTTAVFVEDFELVIDPKELEDVQDSIVSVYFRETLTEILVPKGKSILDVALDNDIEIPYSCQTGICNSCKGKLIYGQVKMIGLTKEREDLERDGFLLCCSYPLVSEVRIEVI